MADLLAEVLGASTKAREWAAKRDDAIRRAREWHSLRDIAAVSGLSHAAVDKIAKRPAK